MVKKTNLHHERNNVENLNSQNPNKVEKENQIVIRV